ncbi:MAG: hypothetical protein QOC71_1062 [Thermoplasmata archaeon]|jgi:hypothetical protein|nr:hypothetical protein [Thermoplasmata archaeon]
MAGNPVLGFLSVQPTGDGPHATVTKMLRLLGIIVLVGAAFSVLNGILLMAMGSTYGPVAGGSAIIGIVFALAIAAAVCFWITYTITHWNNHDPRGNTHALVIGILAAVFGVLGVLGGLVGGLVGAAIFGAGASAIYMLVNGLSLIVSAAEAYCGIMILMNRGKAIGTSGHSTAATN